ncbi:hypothetical protein COCNU_01G018800 [Cocos nucifera]|uniref:Uncharacterized protein n=1 Tax=Cocos nucifera TaxID=13894 RepID=A0A8K0HWT2_COCNU|nr:hypothetical protein COCNU_01G018800 [Cocos nucifera]
MEMKPEELQLPKKDMRKRMASSSAIGQKKIKVAAKVVLVSASAKTERSHCMTVFANTIRAVRSELAEVREKVDAEIGRLKEALTKAEAEKAKAEFDKAAKKKKREATKTKVTKIEKRVEDQIAKTGRLIIEAFKIAPEFTKIKVKFGGGFCGWSRAVSVEGC